MCIYRVGISRRRIKSKRLLASPTSHHVGHTYIVSARGIENRVISHRALTSFKQTLLHENRSAEEAPLGLRGSPLSMNPSSLYSSYSRYKADTNTVTEWLLATSTQCGLQRPGSTDESPGVGPKTSRLKGKARKLARASDAVPSNRTTPVVRHYRIKSHELVNMAQSIAKTKKPRIQVPKFFFRALTRAIGIRKSHQVFYDSCKDGQGRATPGYGHAHFIHILENVLEILRLYAPEAEISPESRKGEDHATVSLTNMFRNLVVEDPDESEGSDTPHQTSSETPKIKVDVDGGNDLKEDEAFIASILLSRDVHEMRLAIQQIWRSYLKGDIDLVAASITTNTAIDFCRKLQCEFDETFQHEKKFHEEGCLYCVSLHESEASYENPDGRMDFCFRTARPILSAFMRNIEHDSPNIIAAVSPAHVGLYSNTKGRGRPCMQGEDEYYFDFRLAMGVLPEFYALILTNSDLTAEHEMVNAVRHVVLKKERPYWTTFAIQLLIDIRHILGESVRQGFEDLRQGGRMIVSNIRRVLRFHREAKIANFALHDTSLQQVVDLVESFVEKDYVRQILNREERAVDPGVVAHVPDFYLLERDPLWCGLLLYKFRMSAHEGAIINANSWTSIMATSHLYNSLRQGKVLRTRWDDMESIISMHGAEKLFIGSLPTTFIDCFKRCIIACGLSASVFARNPRSRDSKITTGKQRKLNTLASASWTFKKRFCDFDGRTDLSPEDVLTSLHKSLLMNSVESARLPSKVSVDSILRLLCFQIHAETFEVTFNHFEMHVTCWKLLRQLDHSLRNSPSEWPGELHQDDRQLPVLVPWLLGEAAEHEKMAAALGTSMSSEVLPNLATAAKIFEDIGLCSV